MVSLKGLLLGLLVPNDRLVKLSDEYLYFLIAQIDNLGQCDLLTSKTLCINAIISMSISSNKTSLHVIFNNQLLDCLLKLTMLLSFNMHEYKVCTTKRS